MPSASIESVKSARNRWHLGSGSASSASDRCTQEFNISSFEIKILICLFNEKLSFIYLPIVKVVLSQLNCRSVISGIDGGKPYQMSNDFSIFKRFKHSFILDISTAPFSVHCYLEVLPTTAWILCRSYTLKCYRHVKDLP